MTTKSNYEGKQEHILRFETPSVEVFRNIFQENLVNKSLEDLLKACSPLHMKLDAIYHIREKFVLA